MQGDLFEGEYPIEKLPIDGSLMDYGTLFGSREAKDLFDRLLTEIPWRHDTAYLYGKHIMAKRKVAWFGDRDFNYHYSNTSRTALDWTPLLLELKEIVEKTCGHWYNSVLLNLYHDGSEGMSWHSDDEKGLGKSV